MGIRTSRRSWAFSAIVVATFALGIGATTAMFTAVNTVLIQPLPYASPDRLMLVLGERSGTSVPDLLDYRARNTVFTSLATWGYSGVTISGAADPEQILSVDVSTNFFRTLGVQPLLGRAFLPDEENRTGDVVMLSYAFWLRRFGGDKSIINRKIDIDKQPALVVGIVPPVLDKSIAGDVYRPFNFNSKHESVRAYHTQPVIGRLKPGVSVTTAAAAMNVIAAQLGAVYPEDKGQHVTIIPYQDYIVYGAKSQLLFLLAAVTVVLLIGCGNIASLLVARTTSRQGELATRVALGASRSRLIRQLLTESAVLALIGGAMGMMLAWALIHVLRQGAGDAIPRLADLRLNLTAFLFALSLSVVAGAIVGVTSAWRVTAAAVQPALNMGGRGTQSRRSGSVRSAIVIIQIASSLVLIAGAAALIDAYSRLSRVDPGFDPSGVLTASIVMPDNAYAFAATFWKDFLPQVAALPDVVSVSAASQLPLAPGGNASYYLEHQAPGPVDPHNEALIDVVTPSYFSTLRIPMISGATFNSDGSDATGVIISNSIALKRFFLQNPIGKRLTFPDFGGFTADVIGVAGDVRASLSAPPMDVIYFPLAQFRGWATSMRLVVRTRRDPAVVIRSLRAALYRQAPSLALGKPRTMLDLIGRTISRDRIEATVLGAFAAVALALAALGLYGSLSYAVAVRADEFSIRYALGGTRAQLFQMVLRHGMKLVAGGLACGLVLVPLTSHVLSAVFHATRVNTNVVIASVVVLGTAGFAACVIPGLYASRLGTQWKRLT